MSSTSVTAIDRRPGERSRKVHMREPIVATTCSSISPMFRRGCQG